MAMTYQEMQQKIEELSTLVDGLIGTNDRLKDRVAELEAKPRTTEDRVDALERILNGAAVQIPNFDGFFKLITVDPTGGNETNGTLRFYDDGADIRIYAKINGTWRYCAMT